MQHIFLMIITNSNLDRLEFKEFLNDDSQGGMHIRIQTDWNLKGGEIIEGTVFKELEFRQLEM